MKKLKELVFVAPWLGLLFSTSALSIYWPTIRFSWVLYENLLLTFWLALPLGIVSLIHGASTMKKTGVRSGWFSIFAGALIVSLVVGHLVMFGLPDRIFFEMHVSPSMPR